MLEAITLAGNAEQVREEIAELRPACERGKNSRRLRQRGESSDIFAPSCRRRDSLIVPTSDCCSSPSSRTPLTI